MNDTRFFFFFFNDTATTEIYTSSHTLSLHDALPISGASFPPCRPSGHERGDPFCRRSEEHTSELQSRELISYAVFCLKKKKITHLPPTRETFKTTECTAPHTISTLPLLKDAGPPGVFFFNDTAPTEIYTSSHTLSLHDALPISTTNPAPAEGRMSRTCRVKPVG